MAKTYTPIATTTLSSATSSLTMSSIPATYTDLVVVVLARDSRSLSWDSLTIQFNGDTASNYSDTYLQGDGSSATSGLNSSTTYIRPGDVSADSVSSVLFGITTFNVMNYSNTTTYKTVIGRGSVGATGTTAKVGLWRSTSAVNSITFLAQAGYASFNIGSTFTIYGIKAA